VVEAHGPGRFPGRDEGLDPVIELLFLFLGMRQQFLTKEAHQAFRIRYRVVFRHERNEMLVECPMMLPNLLSGQAHRFLLFLKTDSRSRCTFWPLNGERTDWAPIGRDGNVGQSGTVEEPRDCLNCREPTLMSQTGPICRATPSTEETVAQKVRLLEQRDDLQ